jgi:hypothetical protein
MRTPTETAGKQEETLLHAVNISYDVMIVSLLYGFIVTLRAAVICSCENLKLNVHVKWLEVLLCIWKDLDSNVILETSYPYGFLFSLVSSRKILG